jgi:TM2 domain-containing membrane protein YozV
MLNPHTENHKYCFECGESIKKIACVCPWCGVSQPNMTPRKSKDKYIAAILAFFLGGLGIHKLYLGRKGWFIIYLVLSLTMIPALIGFIEGCIYLVMSDQEFDTRYNNQ